MSIFIQIENEAVVQVGDKTRIDASRTFVSNDEEPISLLEIQPEAGADFIAVTTDQYLDWAYSTEGAKVITVRVTTDGSPDTQTSAITVLTAAQDNLFSTDADLKTHEFDILQWLPAGRSSYKNVHRRAQSLILAYLDKEGRVDSDGNPFTKAAFVDVDEGKEWSTFLTLRLIFQGMSNAIDDVYDKKAKEYGNQEVFYRDRIVLRLDVDGDGEVDESEQQVDGPRVCVVVRR